MPPHSQRVAVKALCTRVDAAELTARQTNAEAGWKFEYDRLPQNSFTVGSDGTKRGGDVAHGDIAVVHLQNQASLDITLEPQQRVRAAAKNRVRAKHCTHQRECAVSLVCC